MIWLPQSALAQELGGTLQQIKESGVIQVGYRENAVPFSYLDEKGQPIGYGIDYVKLVAQAIKEKLGLPQLQVKMLPISIQNRIPLLLRNAYDFECSATSNNSERQKQVSFSNTFFISSARLLVNNNVGINNFAELRSKNVVVIAGTTASDNLHDLNFRTQLGLRIISTQSYNEAFKILESGLAEALVWDDIILASEIAIRPELQNWRMVGTPLSYEAYGCMLRSRDPQFKQLIDGVIAEAQLSGKAEELFNYWFIQPIAYHGHSINMNFAMSEAMRNLFQNPNDRPFQ